MCGRSFFPLACYFKTNTGRNQSNSLDQPVGQDQNTSDLEPMLTVGLHSSPRLFFVDLMEGENINIVT